MNATLVTFLANGARREFTLLKPRITVGRATACDLRIPLPSISRKHCELVLGNGVLELRDLSSANGTFHNEERIEQAEVWPGDQIRVGPVRFTVTIDGHPECIEPLPMVASGLHERAASAATTQKQEAGGFAQSGDRSRAPRLTGPTADPALRG